MGDATHVEQRTSPVRRVTRHLTFEATPAPVQKDALPPQQIAQLTPSSTIDVFLRVRPFNENEVRKNYDTCVLPATNDTTLKIRPKKADKHPPGIRQAGRAVFKFAKIFDEQSTQEAIFERTTLPLISHLFRGESAVVLAYGVTCSGKTFTIQGTHEAPGILPRALDVIINSIAMAKGNGLAQDLAVSDEVAQLTDDQPNKRRARTRAKQTSTKANHDSNYIDVDPNVEYSIYASYLEIYNDMVFDLFDKSAVIPVADDVTPHAAEDTADYPFDEERGSFDLSTQQELRSIVLRRPPLKLKERFRSDTAGNKQKEVYADGQTEVRIKSVVDIERLLEFGCNNRTVAHTKSNTSSSRSHAVFEITLKQETNVPGPAGRKKRMRTMSRLQIVDLAGSEKLTKAGHSVNRAQESRQINTSLMNLSRCLEAMRRNQMQAQNVDGAKYKTRIVPFRDSKLTRLLQRGLSTGCAVMITTMSPSLEDADETIHTLRNTAIAREIKIKPVRSQRVLMDVTNGGGIPDRHNGHQHKVLKELHGNELLPLSLRKAARGRTKGDNVIEKEVHIKETTDLKQKLTAVHEQLDLQLEEKKALKQRNEKLERIIKLSEDALLETNDERDKLYRENERLREKLAHLEGKVRSQEAELRMEIYEQMDEGFKKVQERYEKQIQEMRDYQNSVKPMTFPAVPVEVESYKRRVMRASSAAFESVSREIQEGEGSDDSDTGSEEAYCDDLEEDLTVYEEDY